MFKKTIAGVAAFGGAGLTAAFLALTSSALLESEELRTTPYLDSVGVPTDCVGNTYGVRMGVKRTEAECMELLQKTIVDFDRALGRCVKVELPMETRSALLQWAYNVGSAGACGSSTVRKLNAGDFVGGCDALRSWNKGTFSPAEAKRMSARGEVCKPHPNKKGKHLCTIRGLTTRRDKEAQSCLAGLTR